VRDPLALGQGTDPVSRFPRREPKQGFSGVAALKPLDEKGDETITTRNPWLAACCAAAFYACGAPASDEVEIDQAHGAVVVQHDPGTVDGEETARAVGTLNDVQAAQAANCQGQGRHFNTPLTALLGDSELKNAVFTLPCTLNECKTGDVFKTSLSLGFISVPVDLPCTQKDMLGTVVDWATNGATVKNPVYPFFGPEDVEIPGGQFAEPVNQVLNSFLDEEATFACTRQQPAAPEGFRLDCRATSEADDGTSQELGRAVFAQDRVNICEIQTVQVPTASSAPFWNNVTTVAGRHKEQVLARLENSPVVDLKLHAVGITLGRDSAYRPVVEDFASAIGPHQHSYRERVLRNCGDPVPRCYRMKNRGQHQWVATGDEQGWEYPKFLCWLLDSCDGGRALPRGCCYKWATCPTCRREPWSE